MDGPRVDIARYVRTKHGFVVWIDSDGRHGSRVDVGPNGAGDAVSYLADLSGSRAARRLLTRRGKRRQQFMFPSFITASQAK